MKIIITGAIGNVGGELAKVLSRRGVRFRAMVRSPHAERTLASLPGVEIIAGDLDDALSLARALIGAEVAFPIGRENRGRLGRSSLGATRAAWRDH